MTKARGRYQCEVEAYAVEMVALGDRGCLCLAPFVGLICRDYGLTVSPLQARKDLSKEYALRRTESPCEVLLG